MHLIVSSCHADLLRLILRVPKAAELASVRLLSLLQMHARTLGPAIPLTRSAPQVTHLGYYASEREAAHVHDLVALSLDNPSILNFDAEHCDPAKVDSLRGKSRPELQRSLGVKPMDKSSR